MSPSLKKINLKDLKGNVSASSNKTGNTPHHGSLKNEADYQKFEQDMRNDERIGSGMIAEVFQQRGDEESRRYRVFLHYLRQ